VRRAVESVDVLGDCPQVGVGGFGAVVEQAVIVRAVDPLAVTEDASGERNELLDARVRRPYNHPAKSCRLYLPLT
jgi:hypothetical protein